MPADAISTGPTGRRTGKSRCPLLAHSRAFRAVSAWIPPRDPTERRKQCQVFFAVPDRFLLPSNSFRNEFDLWHNIGAIGRARDPGIPYSAEQYASVNRPMVPL